MSYVWRLLTNNGQQVWKRMVGSAEESKEQERIINSFKSSRNQNAADRIWRSSVETSGLSAAELSKLIATVQSNDSYPEDKDTQLALSTALKAINYYQSIQMDDGHWPGDYGGPMFLMPGFVIMMYVTGQLYTHWDEYTRKEIIRYLIGHQAKDGGWGLHIEEKSTMFGTVLTYVTLRLLGVPASELTAARNLIKKSGGAMMCPSWGKFWLCVLGVYEWSGCNSLFPEFWLFPERLPFHPSRWWCHCRMVYLPMAYAYGHKVVGTITPLIEELRSELYPNSYESYGDFSAHRNSIAPEDLYTPQTTLLKVLNVICNTYEKCHARFARKKALDFVLEYIRAEDAQTKFVDIGPVNKAINMLCIWHADGPTSKTFQGHLSRVNDYIYMAEDGIKAQGYNGSQLWDTAFATQAIVESGLGKYFKDCLFKSYNYLEISQVLEDVDDREKFYRHISKGAWPFSTRDHGWPISDCSAEGLKASIALHNEIIPTRSQKITSERLEDCVNVILSFQNTDGGWATYENTRGPAWLEWINPAEVFGGIMIDYSYVECTSACMQALASFTAQKEFAEHRREEVRKSIAKGAQFIKSKQREDGSWYGSWAVCFTYGAWFGIEGLIAAGLPESDESIQKGVKFLLSKQRTDGGWGESYKSCRDKVWSEHDKSQVVNTAWATLALMKAGVYRTHPEVITKAIKFLASRQMANGDWDQEGISGVFNGNCMITYINYRNIFPIWACGRFIQLQKENEQNGNGIANGHHANGLGNGHVANGTAIRSRSRK